ncbi:MAG TPA: hypothetical protein VKV25_00990, partial [Acidimicrobiales bacterium]|nr:hypothetical protein [Acidimicrobiales bacterium]
MSTPAHEAGSGQDAVTEVARGAAAGVLQEALALARDDAREILRRRLVDALLAEVVRSGPAAAPTGPPAAPAPSPRPVDHSADERGVYVYA